LRLCICDELSSEEYKFVSPTEVIVISLLAFRLDDLKLTSLSALMVNTPSLEPEFVPAVIVDDTLVIEAILSFSPLLEPNKPFYIHP